MIHFSQINIIHLLKTKFITIKDSQRGTQVTTLLPEHEHSKQVHNQDRFTFAAL